MTLFRHEISLSALMNSRRCSVARASGDWAEDRRNREAHSWQMRREELRREAGLSITLFGGMAIRDNGGANFLPRSRKTRAVVALLALAAPKPVPRTELTGLLWSQREKEQARASLRQAVHELQQTLGPAWSRLIVAERHVLSMDLRGVSVDALAATGPAASRIELLSLFQDGFLEELGGLDPSFDEWLAAERRRLLRIARTAGEAFLQVRNRGGETVRAARALLRIDPVHDGAWRALIQAQIELGERAAARQACEQWRETMGAIPNLAAVADLAAFKAQIDADAGHAGPEPARDAADGTVAVWPAAMAPVGDMPGGDIPGGDMPIGVMTTGVIPAGIFPAGAMGVAEPRDAPGILIASREAGVETGALRRASLRLGIREMRVIGTDVDLGLAAGLADEVTLAFSRFRWISCVSCPPPGFGLSEGFTRGTAPHAALDFVLDGTIQRGGERVRVTVRLLDLRAGAVVVWSNRFDHEASDNLTLQEKIAGAIVAQVDPVLLMREGAWAATGNRRTMSARELVLQAVPSIYRLDRTSFHAAGDLLEAALNIDPAHTDALAWFAYWHLFLVGQGWAPDPEAATNRAALLADSAVALDPNDARALTLAGHVRSFLMKRATEAVVLHDRSLALNPNLALAWCFSGFALCYLGQHELALARMRQAIALSPSDPHRFFFLSAIIMPHLLREEYQEAAAAAREATELNPWFSSAFKGYLAVLGHLGQRQQAASVMSRLLQLEPEFTVRDAIRRSPIGRPGDIAHYAEGLRRAGLPEW